MFNPYKEKSGFGGIDWLYSEFKVKINDKCPSIKNSHNECQKEKLHD